MKNNDGLETLLNGIGLVISGIILMCRTKEEVKEPQTVEDISPEDEEEAKDFVQTVRDTVKRFMNKDYLKRC